MKRPGESCPPLERLLAWTLSLLEKENAAQVGAHVYGCDACVADLATLRSAARAAGSIDAHLHPALLTRWDALDPHARGLELETARRHLDACTACRDDLAIVRDARAVLASDAAAAAETPRAEWIALAQLPGAIGRAADAVRAFLDELVSGGAGVLASAVPVRGDATDQATALDAGATLEALTRGERVRLRLPDGASVAVAHDVAAAALVFTDPRLPDGAPAASISAARVGVTTTVLAASDAGGEMRLPFRELTGDVALIVHAM